MKVLPANRRGWVLTRYVQVLPIGAVHAQTTNAAANKINVMNVVASHENFRGDLLFSSYFGCRLNYSWLGFLSAKGINNI